ncbi:MAG: tryptophan-rich sensory protein [Lachnospiraceae bacterium]|nr:tryptophan-rich sensory protein [Lachnospiraceae bacterium]
MKDFFRNIFNKYSSLIIAIAIPLIVGGFSALLTIGNMDIYPELNRPALAPPGFIFPIVWTILYTLMGVASYLIIKSNRNNSLAIYLYSLQLVFNFFWSIIFFNLQMYLFAFIWLIFLWILILLTIVEFYKISKPAAYLLIPYLVWVTLAGYLNLSIYLLN